MQWGGEQDAGVGIYLAGLLIVWPESCLIRKVSVFICGTYSFKSPIYTMVESLYGYEKRGILDFLSVPRSRFNLGLNLLS